MTDTIQTPTNEDANNANPQLGTEGETTPKNDDSKGSNQDIDYKEKFSHSSAEALRLLEENKKKDEEIARLKGENPDNKAPNYGNDQDIMYPGFENLDEEAKKNLIAYTEAIQNNTLNKLYKDPAIAQAKRSYNETNWNTAFDTVAKDFPDLKDSKDDFKAKYFNADNVPTNIGDILKDVAKVYLFDKASDIGAKREREQANRIEVERADGGDKTPKASRTLEDWNRMAQSNPAEFARQSKQFNEDMKSGKLK